MDFIYFLVTGSDAWEPHFHNHFFVTCNGFMWGLIGALIIGILFAAAFYFGCCNSSNSVKLANIKVWSVFLLISGIVGYFYADCILIGTSDNSDDSSMTRKYSFYKANDYYFIEETSKPGVAPAYIQDLTRTKNEISDNLDKGGDVRFDFDITTAVLAVIFFFLSGLVIKRLTIAGKAIPFK